MSQKKKRKQRRTQQAQTQQGRPRRKRRINTPSLIFIGLILLMAGVLAVVTLFGRDVPDCPPGQVWSAAHDHCH